MPAVYHEIRSGIILLPRLNEVFHDSLESFMVYQTKCLRIKEWLAVGVVLSRVLAVGVGRGIHRTWGSYCCPEIHAHRKLVCRYHTGWFPFIACLSPSHPVVCSV